MITRIFNNTSLETILKNNTDSLLDEISMFNITKENLAKSTESLSVKHGLVMPKLKLKDVRYEIDNENVEAMNFPVGAIISNPVEFVTYTVPFSGEDKLLMVKTNDKRLNSFSLELGRDTIKIKLTTWTDISGNDTAIETIIKEFKYVVSLIEENMVTLGSKLDNYNATLPAIAEQGLKERLAGILQRADTLKRLNPFT